MNEGVGVQVAGTKLPGFVAAVVVEILQGKTQRQSSMSDRRLETPIQVVGYAKHLGAGNDDGNPTTTQNVQSACLTR